MEATQGVAMEGILAVAMEATLVVEVMEVATEVATEEVMEVMGVMGATGPGLATTNLVAIQEEATGGIQGVDIKEDPPDLNLRVRLRARLKVPPSVSTHRSDPSVSANRSPKPVPQQIREDSEVWVDDSLGFPQLSTQLF
uniref:Uncharacterized protein n=1 Tax=Homalodisca liturata TaxID=320908 RepID=A0A1B6K043_9HEMI